MCGKIEFVGVCERAGNVGRREGVQAARVFISNPELYEAHATSELSDCTQTPRI
jgi:hypothetical protein